MGRCYSIIFLLAFISPVKAQPILQLGMYDIDIGSTLNFQVAGQDHSFVGHSWLGADSWLAKCSYRSILVEEEAFAVSEYDFSALQGSLITEYYFMDNSSMALPYLGIEVGWRKTKYGSVRKSGLFMGSKVGIKLFFNDAVSFDSSISYKISTDDVFLVDFETTDGHFYPGIGFRAKF